VLLGLFLVEVRNSNRQAQQNLQLVQSYLRLVDPLLTPAQGNADPRASANLDALLTWMKSDLQLNDEQLARIKNVHEQLSPHLLALASQVAQMQRSLTHFENERQSAGQVDFLEFARYVEQRRKLDHECSESTRRLIAEATDVMTPRQRQQYLQLLDPALKNSGGGSL
jgi:Spy/CpxP family protein refolding chaperone